MVGKNLALGDLMGMIQVLSCCKSHILSVAGRIEAWVCLQAFFEKLGLHEIRFKPTYNPYTEPSMEIFHWHHGTALTQIRLVAIVCHHRLFAAVVIRWLLSSGLNKWVEIGNSGMFRPEMLRPMGFPEASSRFLAFLRLAHTLFASSRSARNWKLICLAAQDVSCIAWGLSLERPTMILYGIDNIRDLFGHKVTHDHLQIRHATSEEAVLGLLNHCVFDGQVDLGMIKTNPICRLVK